MRCARRLWMSIWNICVLLFWKWCSEICGFVSAHHENRSLRKLFIITTIKINDSPRELLLILNAFHTAVRIVWIIKPRETSTRMKLCCIFCVNEVASSAGWRRSDLLRPPPHRLLVSFWIVHIFLQEQEHAGGLNLNLQTVSVYPSPWCLETKVELRLGKVTR